MIDKDLEYLGFVIRKIRVEQKLSQFELAKLANISVCNLSKLENGKLDIRFTTLVRLLDSLDHHFLIPPFLNF